MTDGSPGARAAAVVRRSLSAPRDRVYEAWLDPAIMARWMSPTGRALATTDPRPGGQFRVVMLGSDDQIEHTGRYMELEYARRLVFTWHSPYTAGDSLVTVELADDEGRTELTLTHERLPIEHRDGHAGGWGTMLDLLADLLADQPITRTGGGNSS